MDYEPHAQRRGWLKTAIAYIMVVPDAFPTFPTLPTWLLISLCPPIVVTMALPTSVPFVLGLLFIAGANAVLYMTIGIAIVRLVNAWQRG